MDYSCLMIIITAWFYAINRRITLTLLHKNTRSCAENECCCPRTINISNVNFTSKISIPPEPLFKNMGQQMYDPDSSNSLSIRHESEGWGFESSSGGDIFCLKNFVTFTRTPVRVSKINAVARSQSTFQTLTLLKHIYIIKSMHITTRRRVLILTNSNSCLTCDFNAYNKCIQNL